MIKRALSVSNVANAKFKTLEFEGKWLHAVGKPELTGAWFIYGPPKNGKTTFAMMLVKYLSNFERCAYDSIEEGLSLSIQLAMERVGMDVVGGRVVLLDKMEIGELIPYLKRHKSPNVVVIDSVQFAELTFAQYKRMKEAFPRKLFIYVSHMEGRQPDGQVAKRIWRDSNVVFRVEGYRAFPSGRYGGRDYINIWEEEAEKHHGLDR